MDHTSRQYCIFSDKNTMFKNAYSLLSLIQVDMHFNPGLDVRKPDFQT